MADRQALFNLRWYVSPSDSQGISILPEDFGNGMLPAIASMGSSSTQGDTQLEDILIPMTKPDIVGEARIIRLMHSIFRTITYYCKVCRCCVLRDKDEYQMLSEYCKRVRTKHIW